MVPKRYGCAPGSKSMKHAGEYEVTVFESDGEFDSDREDVLVCLHDLLLAQAEVRKVSDSLRAMTILPFVDMKESGQPIGSQEIRGLKGLVANRIRTFEDRVRPGWRASSVPSFARKLESSASSLPSGGHPVDLISPAKTVEFLRMVSHLRTPIRKAERYLSGCVALMEEKAGMAREEALGTNRDAVDRPIARRAPQSSGVGRGSSTLTFIGTNHMSDPSAGSAFYWLRHSCESFLLQGGGAGLFNSSEDMMAQILALLRSNRADESAFLDLLGYESFEIIAGVLQRRQKLLEEYESAAGKKAQQPAVQSQVRVTFGSKKAQKVKGSTNLEVLEALGFDDVEESNFLGLKKQSVQRGGGKGGSQPVHLHLSEFQDMGLTRTLPEGTERTTGDGWEQYKLPLSAHHTPKEEELIPVSSMPEWMQTVFTGVTRLNTIQSKVFPCAMESEDNFLMCAPTGAGKTNVALLAICKVLSNHIREDLDGSARLETRRGEPTFKCIYMAPMKALVAEIVDKFSSKLRPLGVEVRELTGDMQLTKKEMDSTHVIVTVPEKWDVITRNASVAGGEDSFVHQVKLIIIDEVHLLNDERGAIIESVVARMSRFVEISGEGVRTVALSATLPNYADVAAFLRVSEKNMFVFDSSFRPVPLQQTVEGVSGMSQIAKQKKMLQRCFHHVRRVVMEGHQCMVFVHSRADTHITALALLELARDEGEDDIFQATDEQSPQYDRHKFEMMKAKQRRLVDLFVQGFGIHHAGLVRSDRSSVERAFAGGALRVLVCTATLAWGVNLPARGVVIKGTSIWDSQGGGFKDLGILDVLQIFGRAGRPQFDDFGDAVLLTTQDKLGHYMKLLTNQVPVESQFEGHLCNALNAEIAMGNVTSEHEAAEWLRYTFMFIRFYKTPQKFGITSQELESDPFFYAARTRFVGKAADKLFDSQLIRVDQAKNYSSTQLGRIAARYYVHWETARLFNRSMAPGMSPGMILDLFGRASEFEQLKVRDDELNELESLSQDTELCPYEVRNQVTNVSGKAAVLLQALVSRAPLNSSSLVSDTNYISQNASRIFRALYEICMTRSAEIAGIAHNLLEWVKIVDRKVWDDSEGQSHMLRHFVHPPNIDKSSRGGGGFMMDGRQAPGTLNLSVVEKLESRKIDFWRLKEGEYSFDELKNLLRKPEDAKAVLSYTAKVPYLHLGCRIQPVTGNILRVTLSLTPDFEWSERWSGFAEIFHVWVLNPDTNDILHSEEFVLQKKQMREVWPEGRKVGKPQPLVLSFAIPISDDRPPQYYLQVTSDRWVGLWFDKPFAVGHLLLPAQDKIHTPLLDLQPLAKCVLRNEEYEKLYKFTHFNAIQTQVFHTLFHSDYNVLLGAPTGSGKTIVAELAMFRLFSEYPDEKVVYIAPLKALSKERMKDWEVRLVKQLGKKVVELTGDFTPDVEALNQADVVVTTPEKWDGISRHWQHRNYVKKVGLVVIDEIHLLGADRGPVLEVIVSRMRYISCQIDKPIRFVGLSTALANAKDIGDWLGIGEVGLFNFPPSVRPVPMTAHVQGYAEKHYCPRMATMNKPCLAAIRNYAPEKPTLIFVSSRRQTRLTAMDLIAYKNQMDEMLGMSWVHMSDPELEEVCEKISDSNLKHVIAHGVGLHHAGLPEGDRVLVEQLFLEGKIQILIATSTLAWGVNLPARLVIIKGTEFFDGDLKRYVDFPITDVLQMMGRAGRPQFDDQAYAVIMVHEPKRSFYRRFLYQPFPVESSLHEQLHDHLNAEICAGTISTLSEAITYVKWTYFYRRLSANPSYYSAEAAVEEAQDTSDNTRLADQKTRTRDEKGRSQAELRKRYVSDLVVKCLSELQGAGCVSIKEPELQPDGEWSEPFLSPTHLGKTAALYYLQYRTVDLMRLAFSPDQPKTFLHIFKTLCECPEYSGVPVRHNEDKMNEEFSKKLPLEPLEVLKGSTWESPHVKAFILLVAHMWGVKMPIADYRLDLKNVLDQSIRLIQAMVDVACEMGEMKAVENLILLLQCLHQGVHPVQSSLFMLSKETPKVDLSTGELLEKLASSEKLDLSRVYPRLRQEERAKILRILRGLPSLRVKVMVRCQGEEVKPEGKGQAFMVPPDAEMEVVVLLKYANQPEEFAIAPKFPKKKTFCWWVGIGDAEMDELIGIKRVIMLKEKGKGRGKGKGGSFGVKSVRFKFDSPPLEEGAGDAEEEPFVLSVTVSCDSYVGLDQQFDLPVQVITQEKFEERIKERTMNRGE